jgi:sarcosine oxidase, subunit beta
VRTPVGDVAASSVVLAAGPWSAPVAGTAGVDLPVEPVPRVVVTTSPFPGVPTRRTLVIDADSSFYFHREGGGVLMGMGGRDEPTFSTAVDDRFVADELLPKAVEVFPPVAEAGLRSSWAGLYEMTPDRLPVVGPTPVEGLFVAAGFSGHGFQHGPIVGKLLAEMIVEGAAHTVDIAALSVERFAQGELVREGNVV